MKRLLSILLINILMAYTIESKPYVPVSGNYGFFYASLSPYGEWLECDWGYAWRPIRVVHGWRPYLYGRWVWTDFGWYWISSEPFGWATFHYGRWYYDDYYGWIWIPGYEWGPAWVEWRYNDEYIGWAPLSPYATFSFRIGVSYTHNWIAPVHYWNFIPCRYFTNTRVVDYVQPVERTRRIFGNTRYSTSIQVEDNRIVNRGVDLNFIESRINRKIQRVDVVERTRGKGERFIRENGRDKVESYRPKIDENFEREVNNKIERQKLEYRREYLRPEVQTETYQRELRNMRRYDRNIESSQRNETIERRKDYQQESRVRQAETKSRQKNLEIETHLRETPRVEKQKPQIRERQHSDDSRLESRGRDRRRP